MTAIMPLLILFLGAFAVFLISRLSNNRGLWGSLLSSAVILGAIYSLLRVMKDLINDQAVAYPLKVFAFSSSLRFDFLSVLLSMTVLILGLMVAVFSCRYMEDDLSQDKYYTLLLIMIGAIVGLSATKDLFSIWVFFELMCVSSYILVSFRKEKWEPLEAGFKYLIMSAAGSMLVLLAISVVFGMTGVLDLEGIKSLIRTVPPVPMMISIVMFICGFSVKAAIVPFHTWLPDAHSEAPSGISAMLSGIVIEAGLFAMIRVLMYMTGLKADFGLVLIIMAVVTMTVGNIMALSQTRIKRMLAYSSVAQMGYMILGIGIGFHFLIPDGFLGGFFHIVTHAGMKGLAFLVAGVVIHYVGTSEISEMKGLSQKMPAVALSFAVAAFALAGVPPFSGFMSKWLIYKSGFDAGGWGYALAGIAIFNSVLSLGYYLPAVNAMYAPSMSDKVRTSKPVPWSVMVPIALLTISVIVLGILPDIGLGFVGLAVKNLYWIMGAR
ncbi:MAG: proton-conducting transporter membrane subunit [Candidatus Saganbacteria bacterium]|nr:proton-conducting transporter membrane subunit [Candidatus Saganbacteria bacterium]